MGRKRNDMDICHDVLKVTMEGAKKTQVVYQANLNFNIVKKYLDALIRAGYVEYRENVKLYFTTSQGSWFVDQYSDVVQPIKDVFAQAALV